MLKLKSSRKSRMVDTKLVDEYIQLFPYKTLLKDFVQVYFPTRESKELLVIELKNRGFWDQLKRGA
jgi:hypothetical protein